MYRNLDFTDSQGYFIARSLNMTLDNNLNTFFATKQEAYSMTLQGKIRASFNNLYKYTVHSN